MTGHRRIVVGVDQGTSGTKALALDADGRVLARTSRPISVATPRAGWVDQDPEAMVSNVVSCVRDVLEAAGRPAADVVGIGIANHTESLVVWDARTGAPVLPAMVWQCRRGAEELAPLRTSENAALVSARTGLDLDPTFTAAKLRWLFAARPEIAAGLKAGTLLWGTVDSWLMFRLTEGAVHATEPGNASRTMLFDIDRLAWDPELAALFELDLGAMPRCLPSAGVFGHAAPAFFGAEIPVTAVLGDQQASLFGHGCFDPLDMKITYGTGAFVWVNAGPDAREAPGRGIIRTLAWQVDAPCYAYEGFVVQAGAALEWIARRFGLDGGVGVLEAAERAGGSDGVMLIPAFQGLGSPWWRADARAALLGLSGATSEGHVAHAAVEAVCYQIRAILDEIGPGAQRAGRAIKVDGGLSRAPYLLRLQANLLGQALQPAAGEFVTAYGVALMAGLGAGVWADLEELRGFAGGDAPVEPDRQAAEAIERSYAAWRRATEFILDMQESPGAGNPN